MSSTTWMKQKQRSISSASKLDLVSTSIKWPPLAYQKRAVKFIISRPCAGLFLDPGLGKTAIVLAAFKLLLKKGALRNRRMLVIAPMHCIYNVWPAEVKKWKDFEGLRVVILHGPHKEKLLNKPADIYVINPEGLPWLLTRKPRWKLPSMLVVDESTKFKKTTGSVTGPGKMLRKNLDAFQRRVILTGTPIPNGYLDLFGQIYLLDRGECLGAYVTHYRNSYFQSCGYMGYEWRLLPGAKEEIEKQIAPLVLQMSSDDYLSLPKRMTIPIRVELPEKAREQYETLEEHFFLMLDDGEIRAFNAGAQSIKLRQFTGGSVYDSENRALSVHTAKLDRLMDLIEEIGQPTIVVYEFKHEYSSIVTCFRKDQRPPTLSGLSGKKLTSIVEAWNGGEIPVLCMHPASGGHGLNLQKGGHHLILFGHTWDLEYAEQVVKRIHRPGQKFPTFVYQLIADNTIDEVVLEARKAKDKTQKGLLSALKQYRDRKR